MRIHIGSDHAGFQLKEVLKPYLTGLGYEVVDHGATDYNDDDDYPDFIVPTAKAVLKDAGSMGIVLGGSGQGEAIAANRLRGIRAVVFNGQYIPTDGRVVPHEIMLSRQHNDANILSLGVRFLSDKDAKQAVKMWLETPFSGEERHVRRIKKLDEIVN